MEDPPKQKPKCDEATLRRLADMRKKAAEVRKQKAELRQAEKDEKKQEFQKVYETKVMKNKKSLPAIPETEMELHQPPNMPPPSPPLQAGADDDDDPAGQAANKPKRSLGGHASAKDRYYEYKLNRLQQEEEQKTFQQNYTRMPAQHHMHDIARNQIRANVDKHVFDRVYRELFGN
jgi:hypothetical protein